MIEGDKSVRVKALQNVTNLIRKNNSGRNWNFAEVPKVMGIYDVTSK